MKAIQAYRLTKKEVELLLDLSTGNTEKEVLEKMGMRKKKYDAMIKSILEKTGSTSLVQLLAEIIFNNTNS